MLELKQNSKQSGAVVGCDSHVDALLRPPGTAGDRAFLREKSTLRVALARQLKDDLPERDERRGLNHALLDPRSRCHGAE